MILIRRAVPLLVVVAIGFMGGRAEAARIAFNGAGSQGAIVWDGDGDVSTMANECSGSVCDTSVYGLLPAGFGIQVTTEDPGGLAGLNISAIHLLLSVSSLPSACGPASDVECGPLSSFAGLSDSGWTVPTVPGSDVGGDVAVDPQPIIRLLMQGTAAPGFYALTSTSTAFLTTLNQTILAAAHVGVDVTRSSAPVGDLTPFAVQTAPAPTQPVPEPGTLMLVGAGMAMALRRRINR